MTSRQEHGNRLIVSHGYVDLNNPTAEFIVPSNIRIVLFETHGSLFSQWDAVFISNWLRNRFHLNDLKQILFMDKKKFKIDNQLDKEYLCQVFNPGSVCPNINFHMSDKNIQTGLFNLDSYPEENISGFRLCNGIITPYFNSEFLITGELYALHSDRMEPELEPNVYKCREGYNLTILTNPVPYFELADIAKRYQEYIDIDDNSPNGITLFIISCREIVIPSEIDSNCKDLLNKLTNYLLYMKNKELYSSLETWLLIRNFQDLLQIFNYDIDSISVIINNNINKLGKYKSLLERHRNIRKRFQKQLKQPEREVGEPSKKRIRSEFISKNILRKYYNLIDNGMLLSNVIDKLHNEFQ